MNAAVQQIHGTMSSSSSSMQTPERRQLPRVDQPIGLPSAPVTPQRMSPPKPRQFFIQGITSSGRPFRPSDWAERLAGALSSFRPKGSGIGAHIRYSPYCVPRVIDNVKCVLVNEALRDIEPMAWDFVMNFAKDNELQVVEVLRPLESARAAKA